MRLFLFALIVLATQGHHNNILLDQSNAFLFEKDGRAEYVINRKLDLNGQRIVFPHKCTIRIEGDGCLTNGELVGNHTSIKAGKKTIFLKDLKVSGTWDNNIVYSEWVELKDSTDCTRHFQNLMSLCDGSIITDLYINKGYYFISAIENDAPIKIPSHVYWHNKATIQILPTDFKKYSLISLKGVEDVTIDGGIFLGDVQDHIGTEGEWGHGIKCSGAKNVTIKNLQCNYFWGDGIDLIERDYRHQNMYCDNIKITNVKCFHNRRQGMSIEAAHNILVTNCEFAYTGNPKTTAPSAGVDIEPWNDKGVKIENIRFEYCSFHDNKGPDFLALAGWNNKSHSSFCIEMVNCTIGDVQVAYSSGLRIDKSRITGCLNVNKEDSIYVRNSYVNEYNCGNKVKFDNCNKPSGVIKFMDRIINKLF